MNDKLLESIFILDETVCMKDIFFPSNEINLIAKTSNKKVENFLSIRGENSVAIEILRLNGQYVWDDTAHKL